MKSNRNNILLGILWVCIQLSTIEYVNGQTENHLLKAGMFDKIDSYQMISDSTVRIFGIANHYHEYLTGSAYYADYDLNQQLTHAIAKNLAHGTMIFNHGVNKLYKISLKDGSSITGLNAFDCDYNPPGGIVKLSEEGSVEWSIDFNELEIWGFIENLVFVDSNTIAILMEQNALFTNREGVLVSATTPDEYYKETIETPFGFLARTPDRLDILNSSFEVITSYDLAGIININQIAIGRYLIQTEEKFYEFEYPGLLQWLPFTSEGNRFLWHSDDYYWTIDKDGILITQFDSFFNTVETHQLAPGFIASFGIPLDSTVLVAGEYTIPNDRNILSFKGNEESISFGLPYDIGITNISIADTILVEYLSLPFFGGGWIQHYDFIDVEVTNFGNDTVYNYIIQNQAISECGWCWLDNPTWEFDSIPIPPNSTISISLGPFVQNCIYNNLSALCLTTREPNETADGNYLNDELCESFSLLIGTSDPKETHLLSFYPNPATDVVYFNGDKLISGDLTCKVYNTSGVLSDQFKVNEYAHPIRDYAPGIYLFKVSDQNGVVGYQKIYKLDR